MRHIRKQGNGGHHLNQSHATPPTTDQTATSRWRSFGHKPKVLERLLAEQYGLCCYSELRADQLGLGYHIEHVENKNQHPQRTFDYTNLAASALRSDDLAPFVAAQPAEEQPQAVFGGHAPGKQQSVDIQRFVSPHQADCARYFSYLSDGRVVPVQDLDAADMARAEYTIGLLNLNSPYLVTRRQKWWDELDTLFEEHIANDMSLHCLAAVDLVPHNHKLSPFFSMTRRFFGRIAEVVLAHKVPQLL